MTQASGLSDADLRSELINLGYNAGPVTGTTRKLYEKKLEALRRSGKAVKPKPPTPSSSRKNVESPAMLSTPLSAKKKGKKLQVTDTESSDNELDLTLPTSNTSNKQSRSYTTRKSSQNESSVESEQSPVRNIAKRTPTPPRSASSVNKRTPLRLSGDASSVRGNIFSNEDFSSSMKSTNSQNYAAHSSFSNSEFDDDHMETSRIVSPSQTSYRSKFGSGYRPRPSGKESPIEKIRRFSKGAWSYFSRPVNSLTPCTEPGGVGRYNGQSTGYYRYSKYSPGAVNKSEKTEKNSSDSCDVSGWILAVGGSFLFLLIVAYLCTAHPKTVHDGKVILQGAFRDTFKFLYTYAILPFVTSAIVIAFAFGSYRLHRYREFKKVQRKDRIMSLVERITDVIRDSGGDGVAELHVRDMIMPPTKRSPDDWKLWKEAAEFINLEDSRVRTEVRLIDGDECNVWIWVPVTKQKWQGTAIAENSLTSSLPSKALTRCIKLRGVSFSDRQSEKNELRNELLRKLSPIVPVHMDFVSGAESIVYMMLKDLEDAKKAFCAFHSHWFNGGLISAKYLRDERYIERFPSLKGK